MAAIASGAAITASGLTTANRRAGGDTLDVPVDGAPSAFERILEGDRSEGTGTDAPADGGVIPPALLVPATRPTGVGAGPVGQSGASEGASEGAQTVVPSVVLAGTGTAGPFRGQNRGAMTFGPGQGVPTTASPATPATAPTTATPLFVHDANAETAGPVVTGSSASGGTVAGGQTEMTAPFWVTGQSGAAIGTDAARLSFAQTVAAESQPAEARPLLASVEADGPAATVAGAERPGGTATPAGATGASATAPSQGQTASPAQQLAAPISAQIQSKADQIRVDLHPAELGRVAIRLRMKDGMIQLHIAVEKPAALEALRMGGQTLQSLLQDTGLDPEKLSLSFDLDQGSDHLAQKQEQEGDPSGPRTESPGTASRESDTLASDRFSDTRSGPRRPGLFL